MTAPLYLFDEVSGVPTTWLHPTALVVCFTCEHRLPIGDATPRLLPYRGRTAVECRFYCAACTPAMAVENRATGGFVLDKPRRLGR